MKAIVNGIQVNYKVTGAGPWIILSHPISANMEIWEPQIKALAEKFSVLQYDTRGHGETEATPGPYPMVQLVDDAAHLLAYLGVENAHWIGTSLGGMIGQAFAIKYPDKVDRIVLANTTCQAADNAAALWGKEHHKLKFMGWIHKLNQLFRGGLQKDILKIIKKLFKKLKT